MNPRKGIVQVGPVSGEEFLRFIRHAARSRESGAISTQFEGELRRGDPDVGALGIWACGAPVGAASFALIPLRFQDGGWSGRLDVVATAPEARGHGVGALLVAALMLELHQRLETRWRHVSVVAVHPAIERLARDYGLGRIEGGDTPLYFRDLDDESRTSLYGRASKEYARHRAELARECSRCQRFLAAEPWCRDPGEGKPG